MPIITTIVISFILYNYVESKIINQYNICGNENGKKIYLEFGERGAIEAKYSNTNLKTSANNVTLHKKCAIQFLTCPSCTTIIKFRYLNITRNCGKLSAFDVCGCDYLWIYEPPYEEASGEQYCGHILDDNVSKLTYTSKTRSTAISFTFSNEFVHAFSLDFVAERNRIFLKGFPKIGNVNNSSQIISSPFFPYNYPSDLTVEYVINCETTDKCRINLIFTDFQIAHSSIIEFFDWNGQRMYVTSGNLFRPPLMISSGPALVMRFYANGASGFGYKAYYSFILDDLKDDSFKPDIACGGHVKNLGGTITMMNMISNGTKFYDCIWLIKPSGGFLHFKSHLSVKITSFKNFVGNSELAIRQGLTSNEPSVEILRSPFTSLIKQKEHIVPISQGFYISFKGYFKQQSQLAISYAAFNYRDCFAGSDFLCHNLRCISILLKCDGFDHCGDNSDENGNCSDEYKNGNRADWSKIPNFIFPKIDQYSDLTTATIIFLCCSFGCLIGIIFAMALLLYRMNLKARHQRQIQDHIQTIHAILEGSIGEVEEEIIIPDDPPDYEAPPDYADVIKLEKTLKKVISNNLQKRCTSVVPAPSCSTTLEPSTVSKSCQTTPQPPPESPPPAYSFSDASSNFIFSPNISEPSSSNSIPKLKHFKCFDNICSTKVVNEFGLTLRKSFLKNARKLISLSEENLVRYFSDSELFNGKQRLDVRWSKVNCNGNVFRKSFSTDDMSLL